MATEILVNDGGAPARILPFVAGAAISGGHAIDMQTDGQVDPATDTASVKLLGYALTDAASGTIANVISGRGVLLNVWATGTVASGGALEVSTNDGILIAGATPGEVVAVAVEGQGDVLALLKVLTK